MSWFVPALLVIVIGLPLVVVFSRMGELFVLQVRSGQVRLLRGRVPGRLLEDISDIMGAAGVQTAVLRAVVEDGRARIRARGVELSPPVQQRLRNVLGQWPVAKIRAAPKRRR